jgi:Zn-dependent protease with chaperone function
MTSHNAGKHHAKADPTTAIVKDFDFAQFIEQRKSGAWGRDEKARYAYSADLAMLRSFQSIRPVELAAAAVVRASKEMLRGQLLGTMIKVGPRQFPSIYKIAQHCADVLTVPVPTVYVTNHPVANAYTYGTDEESFIVVHAGLIDHFEPAELQFVIGHETGHIQNKHVIYNTALRILTQGAGLFLGWIVQPAIVALQAWYRRAEITCDRAGLLCCHDLEAASRSFMKLATGSHKLYPEMNLEAYLEQFEEGQGTVGRVSEMFATHPYLPKRIHALRAFAESELYRTAASLGPGGIDMDEVDRRTSQIIQIMNGPSDGSKDKPAEAGSASKDSPSKDKGEKA